MTNDGHYRTYDAGRSVAEAAPKAKRIPLWRSCCALHSLGWSITCMRMRTRQGLAARRTASPVSSARSTKDIMVAPPGCRWGRRRSGCSRRCQRTCPCRNRSTHVRQKASGHSRYHGEFQPCFGIAPASPRVLHSEQIDSQVPDRLLFRQQRRARRKAPVANELTVVFYHPDCQFVFGHVDADCDGSTGRKGLCRT